jgi:hypothetical protein
MTRKMEMTGNLGKAILQTAAQFQSAPTAIWEYVSNSLCYRESPEGCEIFISIDKDKVTISDNSMGMDEETIKRFFTYAGENLARQGKQKIWNHRGINGTGKIAGFGIADSLIVETRKDGKKNIFELSRSAIESNPDGSNSIPVKVISRNIKTSEINGTQITLKGINIKINISEVIGKIEREITPWRDKNIKIAVNSSICEFKELDIINTHIFRSEGSIKDRYGDFILKVDVSRVPLGTHDRGIMVMSNENRIGIEDCAISTKECGSLITGSVDIPDLEIPIQNVTAVSQNRDLKLNGLHKGVQELQRFMGPKLEEVRKDILEKKDEERNSKQSKKLTQITNDLSSKFNKEWKLLTKQLNDLRLGTNAKNANSIYFEPGDDDSLEALIKGNEIAVIDESDIRLGEESDFPKSPTEIPSKDIERDEDGKKDAAINAGKEARRRKSGFLVDHDALGENEHRSIYIKDELKIIINTDHPSVTACLRSVNGDVENISFRRLVSEISFREFEHAIGQEMISDDDLYPASDLLFEMRDHYDRIARVIGPELYNF